MPSPCACPASATCTPCATDAVAAAGGGPAGDGPLLLHLAEGINASAAQEVEAARSLGLLDARLVAIHCVGVDERGTEALVEARAAVVWCPTSNLFLYGRGPSRALLRSGVDVLLGTDALLSGAGTLLDEMRAAAEAGHLDGDALHDSVGGRAARRLGLPAPWLAPGAPADLVVLRRAPPAATAADVRLVVVGGRPRVADASFLPLMEAHGVAVERLAVGGEPRWVEAPLGDVARRATALFPEVGRILAAAS